MEVDATGPPKQGDAVVTATRRDWRGGVEIAAKQASRRVWKDRADAVGWLSAGLNFPRRQRRGGGV